MKIGQKHKSVRILKEISMLTRDPAPGIHVWVEENDICNLHAQIEGPEDSPYSEGIFSLSVQIPERS